MSSSEHDSQLAKWLPQLNAYRNAMDTTASSALETLYAETISADKRIASPVAPPVSQIVHLPIDGILKRIQRSKSFVLGVGAVGDSDPLLARSIVSEIVTRCCGKTNRNAILVTVRTPNDVTSSDFPSCGLYREVRWSYFDQTKTETRAWHAQLSELPRWKQEFGLIVFDLGDVGFPLMPRIGRLCDGIVVQLLDPSNSRETIQALKRLQRDRLTILGAWSVDLCLQHFAA